MNRQSQISYIFSDEKNVTVNGGQRRVNDDRKIDVLLMHVSFDLTESEVQDKVMTVNDE